MKLYIDRVKEQDLKEIVTTEGQYDRMIDLIYDQLVLVDDESGGCNGGQFFPDCKQIFTQVFDSISKGIDHYTIVEFDTDGHRSEVMIPGSLENLIKDIKDIL